MAPTCGAAGVGKEMTRGQSALPTRVSSARRRAGRAPCLLSRAEITAGIRATLGGPAASRAPMEGMEPASARVDPAELLVHGAWMRRLAAALAGAEGDDLAQEAWLVALRRPSSAVEHPRAWLGTVLRNLARMRSRGEARRRAREAGLPPRAEEPSTGELVARAELEQLAVRLVL